jgi:Tol biopolymer transport system component
MKRLTLILTLLGIFAIGFVQARDVDIHYLGIAYASELGGNFEIFVMSPDRSQNRQLTTNQFNDTEPAWSPGGHFIAFISDRDGNPELYAMDSINGANQTRLTESSNVIESTPSWSPDGTEVIFSQHVEGQTPQLVIMSVLDGSTRILTTGTNPSWSPDGQMVAFVDRINDLPQAHLIDITGENRRVLLSESLQVGTISWSPDSEWLALDIRIDYRMDIYRVRPNGQDLIRLTDAAAVDRQPTWRPDGERIIFSSNRDGDYEIYSMALDGSDVQLFTDNGGDDVNPNCNW